MEKEQPKAQQSSPQRTPANTERPDAAHSAVPIELEAIKGAYQKYGVLVLTAVAAVVLALAGTSLYTSHKRTGEQRASALLATARNVQDMESVVARYPNTAVTSLAELRLAKVEFNAGNYDGAIRRYESFKAKYPQHALVQGAEMGRIHCLEAKGQFEQARAAAMSFRSGNADSFLAPEAVFVIARCEEQMGLLGEAKATYENFILATSTNSPWAPRAEEALDLLKKKLSAKPAPAGPAALLPPETNAAAPAFRPAAK
jgi:outer membrane protein assembly factor BamD (BamD/ComL family)